MGKLTIPPPLGEKVGGVGYFKWLKRTFFKSESVFNQNILLLSLMLNNLTGQARVVTYQST